MYRTQAREMMETLTELDYLLGEEMTQTPIANGQLQGFPTEYRGLAKVVRIKDDDVKNWYGMDFPLFVDVAKGETNLLTPAGQMATIEDIGKWFEFDAVDHHP